VQAGWTVVVSGNPVGLAILAEDEMDWYLMVWQKYAEFDGRSRRSEYWMFALLNFCAVLVLGILGGVGLAASRDYGGILFVPLVVYVLAAIIPSLAVGVRRLHDTGKSGWLLLLFFVLGVIPLVGFIAMVVKLVFMCTDSDPGPNLYGPNPKAPFGYGPYGGTGYSVGQAAGGDGQVGSRPGEF
jgi:uncharacterized membrane protein YhaH (DUF805 family)